MLERKTLHLQGKVNTEEKEALEKRASGLEETLEEKNRTAVTLTTQLKKLQVRVCTALYTYTHPLPFKSFRSVMLQMFQFQINAFERSILQRILNKKTF